MKLSNRGKATILLVILFAFTWIAMDALNTYEDHIEAVVQEVLYG